MEEQTSKDKEYDSLSSKIKEIEFKQKVFAWIGAAAITLSSFLTWSGTVPSHQVNLREETAIEKSIKEDTEARKKQAEEFDQLTDELGKLNHILEVQKPTPVPSPSIVIHPK